ncbi:MAG: hypothetical protein CM15mP117_01770 [Alphaproteobacteria bacterium]|nr:MAG: hypothetical protein CM15mP117_01770 [Alphaproteobacteria bacterium]
MGLRPFLSVLTETIKRAEIAANSDGHLSGLSTGLTGLNNLLGGMHKSDLIIIAGRPAMGKKQRSQQISPFTPPQPLAQANKLRL